MPPKPTNKPQENDDDDQPNNSPSNSSVDLSTNDNDEESEDHEDHEDSDEDDEDDEDDDANKPHITAIMNTPPDDTPYVDEANKLLASLGLLQKAADGTNGEIKLNNLAERELYRLFSTNEPFCRSQLLDHPQIKSNAAQFKKKQLEDALQSLIDNNIVIVQNLAGGKTQIFYLNQALRPSLSTNTTTNGNDNDGDKLLKLKKQMESLGTQLQINKVTLTSLNSEIQTMKAAVKTEELEQSVHQLRQELVRRQQRLELLKTITSDPNYIQTLKLTYTGTLKEWKKRREVMKEMTQPYLDTVKKKQRVFLRELGCESEEVELGVSLDEFKSYGEKQRICDAQGRPLLTNTYNNNVNNGPQPTNLISTHPTASSTLQQQQSQQQSQSQKTKFKSLYDDMVVKTGENKAQKMAELLNKPPSPPKITTGRGLKTAPPPPPPQRAQIIIPKLVFKAPPQASASSKKK